MLRGFEKKRAAANQLQKFYLKFFTSRHQFLSSCARAD
jgi:hypothetical protein